MAFQKSVFASEKSTTSMVLVGAFSSRAFRVISAATQPATARP